MPGAVVVHPNKGTAVDGARHLPPPWGVRVSVQHRSLACWYELANNPRLDLTGNLVTCNPAGN